ncbi:MAG TPA: DUF362 domain-containing protein [Pirellulales bacterium]|jgi:uncharacterized protein (DUF362 family)|nr:DUF362 domain-containing protein [Pirellulales bacterium]
MSVDEKLSPPISAGQFDRRALLIGTSTAAIGFFGGSALIDRLRPRKRVFIARNQRYDGPLEQTIRDGLAATGLGESQVRGKRVLLKPNMVEPTRASPQMTTNPAVVLAAAEVFRKWGATVTVGEAPGHVRDTEMALYESRLGEALDNGKLPFADLNYQDVGFVTNAGRRSPLPGFYFPQAVVEADFVVSMPKLKTHHWVGITAALKNLYGTLPGCKYGWPKNVLHHAGIPQTVVDINASLPQTLAIVDGIVCMEGDGPIMGTAKPMGLIVVGTNPTAVDATCSRIIGLDPTRVSYLSLADGWLGPLAERSIQQVGEPWKGVASPFEILDRPHLRWLQGDRPGLLTS